MNDLAENLVQLVNFLDESIIKIEAGEIVDLSRFELDTEILCKKIAALEKEQAKAQGFEKGLEILAEKLSTLEKTMAGRRDEIKQALSNLNNQSKATSAYQKNNE